MEYKNRFQQQQKNIVDSKKYNHFYAANRQPSDVVTCSFPCNTSPKPEQYICKYMALP